MTDKSEWLAKTVEQAIEPELEICDPHHHVWEYPGSRYLLEELLQDFDSGHNIVSTVFVECLQKYREQGPETLKPVGETEFVATLSEENPSENSGCNIQPSCSGCWEVPGGCSTPQ